MCNEDLNDYAFITDLLLEWYKAELDQTESYCV